MKILLVGPDSFIGKNLSSKLELQKECIILKYDVTTPYEKLVLYTVECDCVVFCNTNNKPQFKKRSSEYHYLLFRDLLNLLEKAQNSSPIFYYSTNESILADELSQLSNMKELIEHATKVNSRIIYYQLGHIFGKWDIPTNDFMINMYCYDIIHGIEINSYSSDTVLECYFIDDFIDDMIKQMNRLIQESMNQSSGIKKATDYIESLYSNYCIYRYVETKYRISTKDLITKIKEFHQLREKNEIPNVFDNFTKKLYSTYLSYLPSDNLCYSINTYNSEGRVELFKTWNQGNIYMNVLKPGMDLGNQWHSIKTEKFIVLSGMALILLRKIDSYKIVSYYLSSNDIRVVDIPVGYTYHISNIGAGDLILLIWSSDTDYPNVIDNFNANVQIQ